MASPNVAPTKRNRPSGERASTSYSIPQKIAFVTRQYSHRGYFFAYDTNSHQTVGKNPALIQTIFGHQAVSDAEAKAKKRDICPGGAAPSLGREVNSGGEDGGKCILQGGWTVFRLDAYHCRQRHQSDTNPRDSIAGGEQHRILAHFAAVSENQYPADPVQQNDRNDP